MNDEVPIENGPLSAEEEAVVSKLTNADLAAIDAAILSQSSKGWFKVARVVFKTEDELTQRYPGLSYVFYAERLIHLVEEGKLESQGNLQHMRFSEVRIPASLFIATERFDPSDGKKWHDYCQWAEIPGLVEIVSLDCLLCRHLIKEFLAEDWNHNVNADFRLDYFYHLEYLKQRVQSVPRKNILGLYRNPNTHVTTAPGPGDFDYVGYDLIEEQTQISALTNCGGFPDVFANDELNRYGLMESFERASTVRRLLAERHPEEPHAQCELYAVWRLRETQ